MSDADPGFSEEHAGDVGAHRATVGTPTDHESINVPPIKPGATENAEREQAAREPHETFIPESELPGEEDDMSKNAKDKASEVVDAAKDKAADVAGAAKDKAAAAKDKASEVVAAAKDATPDQVKDAADQAKKRPLLLIAAAGAVVALVIRRIMRRNKAK